MGRGAALPQPRGVTASSEGLRLLPLVRSIVADCAELEFTVNELHGLHTGLIRVGTFTSVANMWIPSLLVSFQKLYPGIEFTLMNSENYSEIEDWIQHGQVDCGFVSLPAMTDLQAHFLKRDTLVAVLPPITRLQAAAFFPLRACRMSVYQAQGRYGQRAFEFPCASFQPAEGALRGKQRPYDPFHGGKRAWHQRDAFAPCGYEPVPCGLEAV